MLLGQEIASQINILNTFNISLLQNISAVGVLVSKELYKKLDIC